MKSFERGEEGREGGRGWSVSVRAYVSRAVRRCHTKRMRAEGKEGKREGGREGERDVP